jgi:hypothetical protein
MSTKPLVLFAVLAAVLPAEDANAQDDTFVQVSALFDAGWKPSSRGLAAAEALYHKMQAGGRPDPRLSYAFALVQMRNHKYDDAGKLLDRVLAANPADIHARRARIWVLAITQEYAAALVQLESLMKQIAAAPATENRQTELATPADGEPGTETDRFANFAGRVMGYIDGPATPSLNEQVRRQYRSRLAGLLSGRQRNAFEEGYTFVQQRFAELSLDREQTAADAKADEQRRQERILDELARERAELKEHDSKLREQAKEVTADFKEALTTLETQQRPLAARQARLETRAAAIVREMAALEIQIAQLWEWAGWTEDPADALRLQGEARRLDLALGRYRVDLRTIEAELTGIAAQQVALARQRQVTVAQQRARADRFERRATELRRAERRISGQEDRANQQPSGVTGAVVSLVNRAKAFTTYDEFPFEEERARLLQSLAE